MEPDGERPLIWAVARQKCGLRPVGLARAVILLASRSGFAAQPVSMRRSNSWLPTLFALILASGCATLTEQRRASREEPDQDSWFIAQRLSLDKVIPVDVRRQEVDRLLRRDDSSPGVWTNVGPTNIGGRVSSLAIGRDALGNELLWMGSAAGGVFSSADGGATWLPRFDTQTALSIGALAVHPTDKKIVFVGTGEEDLTSASYDGEGLFKTTDAGATWSYVGLAETRRIAKIAIDPSNPQRIFVAAGGGLYSQDSNRGLYRSVDGGVSWTKVLYGDIDAGVIDVAIDPSNTQRVYASIWQHSRANNNTVWGGTKTGLYRSLDGGSTWTKLSGGFPTGSVGRIGIAIAPSAPATVYTSVRQTSGFLQGVYKSTNSGDTWTRVDLNLAASTASFGWWFGPIYVAPNDVNSVYFLDLNIMKSSNGGRNWSSISNPLHVDQHALIVESSTGRLLAGNDGGFYKSLNGGSSWTRFTSLPTSQFYDICTDQQNPQRRFGGLQDNNTVRTTTGAADDWQAVLGGDGMECEVDPADSNRVLAESQNGGINRSLDGGNSFSDGTNGIDGAENRNWVTPIRIDRNNTSTVYMGAQKVYRSTDFAASWSAISPDLTASTLPTGSPIKGTVSAIGVSPVDPQVLWAGTDNGNLWVTENGGLSWLKVNPASDPTYWYTEVTADPFDRRTAYATISGYKLGSRVPYLRKTVDLGATWSDISPGLPAVPMNSVIADPLFQGRLFVASDIGMHVTHDAGNSWQTLGSGVPFIVVHDLQINESSWRLYAGTHSRSIYAYDLRQLPQQDFDGDGAGNLDDCARNDASIGPGVPETNDGVDNQCPGDPNFGIVDELSAAIGFFSQDKSALSWGAQVGATAYQVARSGSAQFVGGCTSLSTSSASVNDAALPGSGAAFFYQVRATAPHIGSWGRNSAGTERTITCP